MEVFLLGFNGGNKKVTISYLSYRKKVRKNNEKKHVQEIECMESNFTVDINILDEKKVLLKNYEKKSYLGIS